MKFNTPSRLPIHGTLTTDLPPPLAVMPSTENSSSARRPVDTSRMSAGMSFKRFEPQARHGLLEALLEKPALVVRFHVRKGVPICVVIDALER